MLAALNATTTICEDGRHGWSAVSFQFVEARTNAVANEVKRTCERCPAEHFQIEVSHFDQPMGDGSSRITVEPGRGVVIPASV